MPVMGAVVAADCEPMLVMECMEHGSLYDLIHNYTMVLDGEVMECVAGCCSVLQCVAVCCSVLQGGFV